MPNYQILTCPNCNGAGCPTCQNTGKVRVKAEELQRLKTMLGQMPQATPIPSPQATPQPLIKTTANLAGIIAFSFLSILAGGAAASWYFLKTLKPFLAGLVTLFTLVGTKLALSRPFFQLQEPDDFLTAIKSRQ